MVVAVDLIVHIHYSSLASVVAATVSAGGTHSQNHSCIFAIIDKTNSLRETIPLPFGFFCPLADSNLILIRLLSLSLNSNSTTSSHSSRVRDNNRGQQKH